MQQVSVDEFINSKHIDLQRIALVAANGETDGVPTEKLNEFGVSTELTATFHENGLLKAISLDLYGMWYPFFEPWHRESTWSTEEKRSFCLVENARQYYVLRCLFRAFSLDRLHCWIEEEPYIRGLIIFRRNSQRSKVIPAFEAYCQEVGFACVDDLESPVQRIPDFVVPEEPVVPAVGAMVDLSWETLPIAIRSPPFIHSDDA